MQVVADGRSITLRQGDFLAAGGEATLYARGDRVYKLYSDPDRTPEPARLAALSRIGHPAVVVPDGVVCDPSGRPIGVTLRLLADALPFGRLCTRVFQERNNLGPAQILALAERLAEAVAAVHAAGCAVVDLHENNLLVSPGFDALWLIDADSWATPGCPATAVADAVRDPHHPPGPAADWFAFAVTTFRAFVGIHPYGGVHSTITGLADRMAAGCSVLRPEVRCPPATLPFDGIPPAWRAWYEAVFERRLRTPPPVAAALAVVVPAPAPASGVSVRLTHVGRALPGLPARVVGERLVIDLGGRPLVCALLAHEVCALGAGFAVRAGDALLEVSVHPGLDAPLVRTLAAVNGRTTRLFDGVAVQHLLGGAWVLLLGPGRAEQRRVPELDGHEVLAAVGTARSAWLLASRRGQRVLVRLRGAETRVTPWDGDLDVLVLPTGVVVERTPDGLRLGTEQPGDLTERLIPAPELGSGRLVSLAGGVGWQVGADLYRITLV